MENILQMPSKGMRFLHSRVLDTQKFDGKTPQMYEVTRVAQGCVYYRPVYDLGFPSERLGASEYCQSEKFNKVCKSYV